MLLHADGVEMLIVKRLAMILLCAAAAATATACIFDEGGDYTGGGRKDTGAKFGENQEPTGEDGGGTDETQQDSGGTDPFADVFGGGGG